MDNISDLHNVMEYFNIRCNEYVYEHVIYTVLYNCDEI